MSRFRGVNVSVVFLKRISMVWWHERLGLVVQRLIYIPVVSYTPKSATEVGPHSSHSATALGPRVNGHMQRFSTNFQFGPVTLYHICINIRSTPEFFDIKMFAYSLAFK